MPIGLIVENNAKEAGRLQRYLAARDFAHHLASTPQEAIAMLKLNTYDFIFLDLDLGAGIADGEGVLAWMERTGLKVPTFILSEAASLPAVVRFENAYPEIVVFRTSHENLVHLGDLLEKAIAVKKPATGGRRMKAEPPQGTLWLALLPLLVALICIIVLLGLLARWLEKEAFLLVLSAALALFAMIAIVTLRYLGKLSEGGFRHLINSILRRSH